MLETRSTRGNGPRFRCASGIGSEFHDEDDVRYLLRHLDIRSFERAVEIITKYYPVESFPQKTLYALGELLPKPAESSKQR
jgi:hypothetical protein